MADQFTVSVGLSAKVSNPQNPYENSTFSRTISRTITIDSMPDDTEKVAAYENHVQRLINNVEQRLKKEADDMVQAEMDAFYSENSGETSTEDEFE